MESKLDLQLLVFDWDGTLMDSAAQIVSCMHAAINDLKLQPRTDEQISNIIGLGLYEAIDSLYPGKETAFHKDFTERYRYHWFESNGSSSLFEGARETILELQSLGYKLAVATGKGRAGLEKVLKETDMEGIFHATRCSDESGSKPHPAMLHEIMESLDIAPEYTLLIGDTEYDLEMASNAGTHSVGVAYGVHSPERLMAHNPLAILKDIRELNAWLVKRTSLPSAELV